MKLVIQRVKHASVTVDGNVTGKIGKGFLVLIGIANSDTKEIADQYLKKLLNLRIFEDENGKTINGSKKAKVLDAIDKMQLSKKQKDWLYLDAGYSEKDIGKAPWNS